LIGAEHGGRNPERLAHRNGYRPRHWDTRAGEIELAPRRVRNRSAANPCYGDVLLARITRSAGTAKLRARAEGQAQFDAPTRFAAT
jgi:Transposase, Mutator family